MCVFKQAVDFMVDVGVLHQAYSRASRFFDSKNEFTFKY